MDLPEDPGDEGRLGKADFSQARGGERRLIGQMACRSVWTPENAATTSGPRGRARIHRRPVRIQRAATTNQCRRRCFN